MNTEQIRIFAKSIGISSSKLAKAELIKKIQAKEGNFDCYATAANRECDQGECRWRSDCFDAAGKE